MQASELGGAESSALAGGTSYLAQAYCRFVVRWDGSAAEVSLRLLAKLSSSHRQILRMLRLCIDYLFLFRIVLDLPRRTFPTSW